MSDQPLWSAEAMAQAMGAARAGPLPADATGISIDSRSIAPGEAFFAIAGENRDGHDFVAPALAAGAGLAVIAADMRAAFPAEAPVLVVPDVLAALYDLARAARARSPAKFIGITGSVGKTSTKEALRVALAADGATHASVASYNNHWGVPLSLARCPQTARYAVLEIGMNHAGEIAGLTRLARPHVAIITTIEPVHLEFLGSVEAIADAKAEIFLGLEPDGAAVINRDNAQFTRLRNHAKAAGVSRIVSFGEHARADARLIKASLHPDCSTVQARILGTNITYKLGAPGRHVVHNSLAVLAAVALAGADLALAALALAQLRPATGRGARITLETRDGAALLIDESYNANPASMRAALALLGQAEIGTHGRRIAVIGDMLELGSHAAELHRQMLEPVLAHGIDLVFCCGPLMHALWEALPSERRAGYAETSALLEPQVLAALRPGDTVMVKGSLGSRMGPIVKALERRYSRREATAAAPAQG
ncbi:MAG TPA: UDP-N-acetylmuramoylalanyl-D-glutamyl-2,6-diaminopimelate--D-alanyl-D-alanine ligase [Xanthobacteraceae bacterium]|jgi:UDP-N-acetylmuramoyl-tripeptide--D-alanyl-D-alanine ligase|nr:UDP-N-acetylmuramoylalanyl-D-glutamyl-2,6-diaminopimelate--D-alanyl-D-alanine ligase [Xanthobacteraceae bacterium]